MQCEEAERVLDSYVAGYLMPEPSREFETHIKTCSRCAERLRLAQSVLEETGSVLGSMFPGTRVEDRILQTVAASSIVYDKTWSDIMREQWERAPWWMISAAVHATILMLMTVITVATAQKRTDDIVITTDLAKKKEPEYDEKKVRDIFRNTKEVEADEIVENPVFVHEEVEVTDHFETENDMDTHTARGQEDAISDIPLGGTGVVGNIGVGGGGAGCFGYRSGGGRRRCVAKFGGSKASESAVDAALRWLARHQEPDGHWDSVKYGAEGKGVVDTGVTGLACLAFLGAGHTERAGQFKQNVLGSVGWMIKQQDGKGCIVRQGERHIGYHHAIAGLALAESYGMARNPKTGQAAQKAIDYSINEHQVEYGAWRYTAKQAADTSVTGWFIMQLKSAKVAGLKVDGKSFSGASAFLDKVTTKPGAGGDQYGGRVGYQTPVGDRVTLTAVGMVGRLFMGYKANDPMLIGGAEHLMENLPMKTNIRNGKVSFYYWYYGTLGMFQVGGKYWKAWNGMLRDHLVGSQRRGGDEDGSWDFQPSAWSYHGGRVMSTALGALCLEVYYRYLPMYK